MPFKVAARTILELGAELISSDSIALYELVKNAIDAESKSGVEIDFVITLTKRNYERLKLKIHSSDKQSVDSLSKIVRSKLEDDILPRHWDIIDKRLNDATCVEDIGLVIEQAYSTLSYIEIRDQGTGMSLPDLKSAFLTIGTPNRLKQLELDISGSKPTPSVLGEKGIGRLSVMRLGENLEVISSKAKDKYFSCLDIDWTDFEKDTSLLIDDVKVDPRRGRLKPDADSHGTTLRITRLHRTWGLKSVSDMANIRLARITDPFRLPKSKRRFGIYLRNNEIQFDFKRYIDKSVLDVAHAVVRGKYVLNDNSRPTLILKISVPLFGKAEVVRTLSDEYIDSLSSDRFGDISPENLASLGEFDFELYWYNRGRLKKTEGFENLKQLRKEIAAWTGIMLYRDGYQVLPYGEENTDWLELDRDALGSRGYKLNKAQFVGRVRISRIENRHLIDQTNREGLRDCDEKKAFLALLQVAIKDTLKPLLESYEKEEKAIKDASGPGLNSSLDNDPASRKREVDALTIRARESLERVKPASSQDQIIIKDVLEMFDHLEAKYEAAEVRLAEAEHEHERLIDLAGVGLMVESLAHELTRSVEYAVSLINSSRKQGLPQEIKLFFETLKVSMTSIAKRLKIIDPLSPSGRQRKSKFDFRATIEAVLDGHKSKFERHNIILKVLPAKSAAIPVYAIEGRIIQIVENLISNSVFWLKAQEKRFPESEKIITLRFFENGMAGFEFSDSGPGIPPELSTQVFKSFFSTKPKMTRQGLGLYIARECAEFHGGTLELNEERFNERSNLYMFTVEIPKATEK